jgi:hypothetical protein
MIPLQILLNSVICRLNLVFDHLFDQLLVCFVYTHTHTHDSSLFFPTTLEGARPAQSQSLATSLVSASENLAGQHDQVYNGRPGRVYKVKFCK